MLLIFELGFVVDHSSYFPTFVVKVEFDVVLRSHKLKSLLILVYLHFNQRVVYIVKRAYLMCLCFIASLICDMVTTIIKFNLPISVRFVSFSLKCNVNGSMMDIVALRSVFIVSSANILHFVTG
jgi:hypothetical protein